MTKAPERFDLIIELDDESSSHPNIYDARMEQDDDGAWVHIDHALALVATEREAWASEILTHIAAYKTIGRKGAYPPLNESFVNTIRARTPDDATEALERVKQDAFQEGYEQAKADETSAIIAAKREARNDALRELREKWIIRDLTESDFTENQSDG